MHPVTWPLLHGLAGSIESDRGACTGAIPGGISMYIFSEVISMVMLPEAGSTMMVIGSPEEVSSRRSFEPLKYMVPVAGPSSAPPLMRMLALSCCATVGAARSNAERATTGTQKPRWCMGNLPLEEGATRDADKQAFAGVIRQ